MWKNKIILVFNWIIRDILFFLPDIPLIMRLRGWLYGFGIKKCGRNFQVTHDVIIRVTDMEIGNNVYIGNHSILLGRGKIQIGDDVLIGPNVIIVSGNHYKLNGNWSSGSKSGYIIIGKCSWIAGNSTITINSSLPEGSALGANSLLNKPFELPNCLYGGVPARLIKKIEP